MVCTKLKVARGRGLWSIFTNLSIQELSAEKKPCSREVTTIEAFFMVFFRFVSMEMSVCDSVALLAWEYAWNKDHLEVERKFTFR